MSEVMNKILQSHIELHAMVKQQQREMSVMANHLTALTDELYSTKNWRLHHRIFHRAGIIVVYTIFCTICS